MNLARFLEDWTDVDVAEHALAQVLGIVPPASAMRDAKAVYWSENRLGNELVKFLERLTTLGFLERRDEPDLQYRSRSDFRSVLAIEEVWRRAKGDSPKLTLIVLRCRDIERSREFYAALGLTFTPEQHGSGPRHYSTQLGDSVLELYPSTTSLGGMRLGICVADIADVVAAVHSLGAVVVSLDDGAPPRTALIRDPDGNTIELTASS